MSKQDEMIDILNDLTKNAVDVLGITEKAAKLRLEGILKSGILKKYGPPTEMPFQIAIDAAMQIPQLGENES